MRSIFVMVLVIGLAILVVAPAMAQTEDELVAQFLQKAKKKHTKNVGYLMLNGSFGRLFQDNDYNKMVTRVSPLVADLSGGTGNGGTGGGNGGGGGGVEGGEGGGVIAN